MSEKECIYCFYKTTCVYYRQIPHLIKESGLPITPSEKRVLYNRLQQQWPYFCKAWNEASHD